MKKVLIITYYWPPSGGGGVQRWLKFVKYLREFNWEPVVYTPENPDFELRDNSLMKDVPHDLTVIKRPIWEPFKFYRLLLGKRAVQKQGVVAKPNKSLLAKLSVWLRGNYFIPDARVFWVRPSVNYLTKYLKKNKIEVLITTGPPHSLHLIGLELKKRLNIKWLADFRDPWSKWDVLDQLQLSARSRQSHEKLEQAVLTNANQILTVSPSLQKSLTELGGKVTVITNGYDVDVATASSTPPVKFRLAHIGLLNEGRNPEVLWQVLANIIAEVPGFAGDLEIFLSGTIEDSVIASIKSFPDLAPCLTNAGYLSHQEVTEAYAQSAVLLLLINNTDNARWILPGKMFEYLAQRKPILAFGKEDSDASEVLTDAGYGPCLAYQDIDKAKAFILQAYANFKEGNLIREGTHVEKYHRQQLTKSLAACLDQL